MQRILRLTTISFYVLAVLTTTVLLIWYGGNYYSKPFEERFFHNLHNMLKPSGILGHGYGIIGTLLILIGISSYMLRKRFRLFSRMGALKYWLEFHILLCTLGPILILFHTAFKFGGIVSISFWSMAAVFISGIFGRYIYLQIPRTISGNELSLAEMQNLNKDMSLQLKEIYHVDERLISKIEQFVDINSYKSVTFSRISVMMISDFWKKRKLFSEIKKALDSHNVIGNERKTILKLSASKLTLARRIGLLSLMQKIFNLWHIIHLPFALIMIIIMVIHVAITLVFGYKWIF